MLVVHIIHVCLCSAQRAPEAVCRYQHFVDEGCARRIAQADLLAGEATNSAYLAGTEERQKRGVLCMRFFRRYQGRIQKKSGCYCGKTARQSKSVRDHQTASSHGAEERH